MRRFGDINLLLVDTNALITLSTPECVDFLVQYLVPRLRTVAAVNQELQSLSRSLIWATDPIQQLILDGDLPMLRSDPQLIAEARTIQNEIAQLEFLDLGVWPADNKNWAESVLIARALLAGPNDVMWTDDKRAQIIGKRHGVTCLSTFEVLAAVGRFQNDHTKPLRAMHAALEPLKDFVYTDQEAQRACEYTSWTLSSSIVDLQEREPFGVIDIHQQPVAHFYPDAEFLLRLVHAGNKAVPFIRALGPQLVVSAHMLRYVADQTRGTNDALRALGDNVIKPDVEMEAVQQIAQRLNDAQFEDYASQLPHEPKAMLEECSVDAEGIAAAWQDNNGWTISFQPGREALLRSVDFDTCSPLSLFETLAAARPELRPELKKTYAALSGTYPWFDREYTGGRNVGLSTAAFDASRTQTAPVVHLSNQGI